MGCLYIGESWESCRDCRIYIHKEYRPWLKWRKDERPPGSPCVSVKSLQGAILPLGLDMINKYCSDDSQIRIASHEIPRITPSSGMETPSTSPKVARSHQISRYRMDIIRF